MVWNNALAKGAGFNPVEIEAKAIAKNIAEDDDEVFERAQCL